MKFLHTSDWHLGMTRHFLSDEAQARFTAARIDAIRTIGALAAEHGCAFVVACGDLFESNFVERQVVVRALDAMKAFPEVRFYLLPGNHDALDASSVYRSKTFADNRPGNVVVLEEPGVVPLEDGFELVAAPCLTKRPLGDGVAQATVDLPADGTRRVVVGHGVLDALSPDADDPSLVSLSRLEDRIAAGAMHYVALGDRHSATDAGATGRIHYSGAPEPTDYREIDAGQVLVVDLAPDGVSVEPRQVGTWRFVRRDFEVTGRADCDLVGEFLDSLEHKDRTIVKLALVGQLSLGDHTYLEELLDHHRDLLAGLETWERRSDLVVVPDDADFERLRLSGFARDAFEELRELASGSGEGAVTARDALALLYRLGGVGR